MGGSGGAGFFPFFSPLKPTCVLWSGVFYSLKNIVSIFRERRRKEREGEKHQCFRKTSMFESNINGFASYTCPNGGTGLEPRCVPWPGIEPSNFRNTVWYPTNRATPVRATHYILITCTLWQYIEVRNFMFCSQKKLCSKV